MDGDGPDGASAQETPLADAAAAALAPKKMDSGHQRKLIVLKEATEQCARSGRSVASEVGKLAGLPLHLVRKGES